MTSPAALSSLDAALRRLPLPLLVALGLAGVALIALLDTASHHSLPLVAFYVAPVLAVGWLSRSGACGLVVAAAAVLVRPLEVLATAPPLDQPAPNLGLLVVGAAAQLALYLVLLALLGSLCRYLEGREAEALRDALTGIANRRAFLASAAAELERSRRYHHQLSLLYLDVDDFKAANDHLGHAEGNRLLRRLAAVLIDKLRAVDTAARLGGDEFAVLMPETGSRAAGQLAERLMAALGEERERDGAPLSCSAGLVTYRTAPASVEACPRRRRPADVRGQGGRQGTAQAGRAAGRADGTVAGRSQGLKARRRIRRLQSRKSRSWCAGRQARSLSSVLASI